MLGRTHRSDRLVHRKGHPLVLANVRVTSLWDFYRGVEVLALRLMMNEVEVAYCYIVVSFPVLG